MAATIHQAHQTTNAQAEAEFGTHQPPLAGEWHALGTNPGTGMTHGDAYPNPSHHQPSPTHGPMLSGPDTYHGSTNSQQFHGGRTSAQYVIETSIRQEDKSSFKRTLPYTAEKAWTALSTSFTVISQLYKMEHQLNHEYDRLAYFTYKCANSATFRASSTDLETKWDQFSAEIDRVLSHYAAGDPNICHSDLMTPEQSLSCTTKASATAVREKLQQTARYSAYARLLRALLATEDNEVQTSVQDEFEEKATTHRHVAGEDKMSFGELLLQWLEVYEFFRRFSWVAQHGSSTHFVPSPSPHTRASTIDTKFCRHFITTFPDVQLRAVL